MGTFLTKMTLEKGKGFEAWAAHPCPNQIPSRLSFSIVQIMTFTTQDRKKRKESQTNKHPNKQTKKIRFYRCWYNKRNGV